jgi:hypothetical protein
MHTGSSSIATIIFAHFGTAAEDRIHNLDARRKRSRLKFETRHSTLRRMTNDEVLQVFRDAGALLDGHFLLRSGLHSRQYFQCALALQQMPVVEKLGAEVARKVRGLGAATVIAPAMGGLVIGQKWRGNSAFASSLLKKKTGSLCCAVDSRLRQEKRLSSSRML